MALSRTNIEFTKTYATEANAQKAVDKVAHMGSNAHIRYDIMPVLVDGKVRYGVLFFGQTALQAGMHWHFNVVA